MYLKLLQLFFILRKTDIQSAGCKEARKQAVKEAKDEQQHAERERGSWRRLSGRRPGRCEELDVSRKMENKEIKKQIDWMDGRLDGWL